MERLMSFTTISVTSCSVGSTYRVMTRNPTDALICCPTLRISRGAPCAPSAACACSADCRQLYPPFSGGNLYRCVKVDLSRCPARHYSSSAWAWRTNTVSPHSAEMKLNRRLDALEG